MRGESRTIPLAAEVSRALRTSRRLSDGAVYLVGGALRDALLGRPFSDLDLAAERPLALARRLARAIGRKLVVLDENERVYRVILSGNGALKQIDVAGFKGATIIEDLKRRDFTVNALAWPIPGAPGRSIPKGQLLDPRGGLRDLKARRLRCESASLFREDPLRILRAFRLAGELAFSIEPATFSRLKSCRHLAAKPAGERIRSELVALLNASGAAKIARRMDEARVLTAVFKELEPQRHCAKSYYGPGGVLTHSLEVDSRLEFLLSHLREAFPRRWREIHEFLNAGAGQASSRRALLLLSALVHDIAKPKTAKMIGGRLRFFGHDRVGARMAKGLLERLRFSREESKRVAAIVLHHLRPGNLAASGQVTERASYRFFRDVGEPAIDLLLVCWADHASYLPEAAVARALKKGGFGRFLAEGPGEAPERKTFWHLAVVSELIERSCQPERARAPRLLDGNDVMKILGIAPGPEVGRWLEKLAEAQALGRIATRMDAAAFLAREKKKLERPRGRKA